MNDFIQWVLTGVAIYYGIGLLISVLGLALFVWFFISTWKEVKK